MSCKYLDSFDHYATADMTGKWTAVDRLGVGVLISPATGRNGAQSLRFVAVAGAGSGYFAYKTLGAQATWIVGFAFRTGAMGGTSAMFTWRDAGTDQCSVGINPDGTLFVSRGGTVLGTSTDAISTSTYNYVEWKVTISNSIAANSCQVRVNGVLWINVTTGLSTRSTANSTANSFAVGPSNAGFGGLWDFGDRYVCDGTGGVNDTFLGDLMVNPVYADGAGTTTQFTASAGSNYACVDEALANGDTDYVGTGVAANIDLYTYGSVGSPASVKAVQWVSQVRKTDASSFVLSAV